MQGGAGGTWGMDSRVLVIWSCIFILGWLTGIATNCMRNCCHVWRSARVEAPRARRRSVKTQTGISYSSVRNAVHPRFEQREREAGAWSE